MTTFDERERAFENRFVHELELLFTASAIRNRRIANWAAKQARLPPHKWSAYESEIVQCGAAYGDEAVFQRLLCDLEAAGASVSEHRLHRRMEEGLAEAMRAQYPSADRHNR